MRLHYRYLTKDGETHEVVADLQVAVACEQKTGKAFWELAAGKLDDQLAIVHEAYWQGCPEGATKRMLVDWKQDVVDFQLDGKSEASLPPLDEAELAARGITRLTP